MPTVTERLETATTLIENNANLFYTIVNGTSATTVTTTGGPVKTAARVIGEAINTLASSVSALEETATNSAAAAVVSEANAAVSAANSFSSSLTAINSASRASTSETNAGNSAASAAVSETNAGNSAAASFTYSLSSAASAAGASASQSAAASSATSAASSANIVTTITSALSTAGFVVTQGPNQLITRTINGTTLQILVTFGDGLSGSPTISIVDSPILTGAVGIIGTLSAANGVYASGGITIPANIIGETVTSFVPSASAISLPSASATNITSITLSAGNWDIEALASFTETTATVTSRVAGIGITSITLPNDGTEAYCDYQTTTQTVTNTITLPRKRITITSPTTVYLVGQCTFSAGTCSGFGYISACRV